MNTLPYRLALVMLVASAVSAGGCAPSKSASAPAERGSGGMSSATTAVAPAAGIAVPAPPRFTTPREAVVSYLAWVSFAYEMSNSDVATQTFTPEEEVRVNSYIQLNKEKNQRIRQRLVGFEPGKESRVGSSTLVPARETWNYSYIALSSGSSASPTYTASYLTTYTLVPRDGGGWIVSTVEAKALGEVK
jgi:hypothetical protein